MKVIFFQAGYGDCILVSHKGKNVIIDSGPQESEAFNQLTNNIRVKGQRIDLLVITHYDRDHIGGLLKWNKDNWNLVDNIWFNSGMQLDNVENNLLSQNDAFIIQRVLKENNVTWDKDLAIDKIFEIGDNWSLKILYSGYDKVPDEGGEFLTTPKCDWESTLKELEPYLNDKALDKSESNASSIILLLTNGRNNILLPGDSTPESLLRALSFYSEEKPLHIDLFKLPHHGSYKNITEEILKKIICSDFVILTNGEKYYHPDKKMMLKVLKWGNRKTEDTVRFHLNYFQELCQKLNISEDEKRAYNFELDGQSVFEL